MALSDKQLYMITKKIRVNTENERYMESQFKLDLQRINDSLFDRLPLIDQIKLRKLEGKK